MATCERVRYSGVYPGLDLVFHSERGQTEYDFVVAPGADHGPSFSATPLKDGSTLVAGGSGAVYRDGVTSALDSAELYGPGLEPPLADLPGVPAPPRQPSDTAPWLPAGGAAILAAVAALLIRRRRHANLAEPKK